MNPKKIIGLAILSGVPFIGGVAYWMYSTGNFVVAGVFAITALADVLVGLYFLRKGSDHPSEDPHH